MLILFQIKIFLFLVNDDFMSGKNGCDGTERGGVRVGVLASNVRGNPRSDAVTDVGKDAVWHLG